jgi:hypothetical protein
VIDVRDDAEIARKLIDLETRYASAAISGQS